MKKYVTRKYYNPQSKVKMYENIKVLRVVEEVHYDEGRQVKTVFEVKSDLGNTVTCIYWKKVTLNAGDEITLIGRFNDSEKKTFICSQIYIMSRAQNEN
jgi:hypothetical protein